MTTLLYASTVFSSAFLLFLVQPMVSKHILPWFGGSAAVWAVCMVFFQVMLLAGYAYSDWSSRRLRPLPQVLLHMALLALSAATLSVLAGPSWKPAGSEDPALHILLLLAATIGLPYFLLSTTGPLLQSWLARTHADARVYRFFALSNLASLLALLCYPFLVEPNTALLAQSRIWSGVYLLFAALCCACALRFLRRATPAADARDDRRQQALQPGLSDHLQWLALSALGCWLLIAVTNHITQNIASVPFLWILPLTLYLLSFVLCFESERWYRRSLFLLPVAAILALCAYGLQDGKLGFNIKTAVPLYAAGLFFLCMFLHGELAAMRPAPRHLTRFYLMVSLGGALGGVAVGLAAPRLLPAYYELGIGLAATALLGALVLRKTLWMAAAALGLALLCSYFLYQQVQRDASGAQRMERSFYGSLRVIDRRDADTGESLRGLYHGAIRHGEQYLAPERRAEPTTYYGRTSGVALALQQARAAGRRVAVIGLGAGTLAAYGRPGDTYRFYEINPQVIDLANTEFSFLHDSAAKIEIVQGDARLALEREAQQGVPEDKRFDVLAVDAFSGDSIPVHLITREALALYLRHLRPEGIVAFHVTNKFLNLAPVVQRLADDAGAHAMLIEDEAEATTSHRTLWVLVARDPRVLQQPALRDAATSIDELPVSLWTDDFNNLFEVLH